MADLRVEAREHDIRGLDRLIQREGGVVMGNPDPTLHEDGFYRVRCFSDPERVTRLINASGYGKVIPEEAPAPASPNPEWELSVAIERNRIMRGELDY